MTIVQNILILESQISHVLSHLTVAILKDDVIANFQLQKLRSYTDEY